MYRQMNTFTKERIRRSVPLSKEEISDLKRWIKEENENLKSVAAGSLGISRTTLDKILLTKSCAQKTYDRLTEIVYSKPAA